MQYFDHHEIRRGNAGKTVADQPWSDYRTADFWSSRAASAVRLFCRPLHRVWNPDGPSGRLRLLSGLRPVEVLGVNTEELLLHGFPAPVVKMWCEIQGTHLLPLQRRAICDYELLNHPDLLIAAPTSSGKTFCGELALVRALCRRKKAVYVTPLKALAAEQYARLSSRLKPLGWRVILVTGEYRDNHAALLRGEFDLAVVVYEKFERWLTRRLDQMAALGLVVCDELQLIYDPERGGALEVALTLLRRMANRPALLGLSAVLPAPGTLADWLQVRVLEDTVRPSELRLGVYHNGRFRYRDDATGREGEEHWPGTVDRDPAEQVTELVRDAVGRGDQVMVFLESRARCQRLARHLAERLSIDVGSESMLRQLGRVRTATGKALSACLEHGVGFHHAGLTATQRELVEGLVRRGDLRVLCATGTLAAGVNLPADTVIIRPFRYIHGPHTHEPVCMPLRWSEFENRAGRAGRFGISDRPGRAILVAETELEADILWREFVAGRPQPHPSGLHDADFGRVLLEFVVAGAASTADELKKLWAATFYAATHREESLDIVSAVRELIETGFLQSTAADRFEPTALGRATVHSGVSVESARAFAGAAIDPGYDDPARWVQLVLHLSECATLQWPPAKSQRDLLTRPTDPGMSRANRMADLVCGWQEGRPVADLERMFGLPAGVIQQNMHTIAWLLDAAARITLAVRGPERRVRTLIRGSFEIQHGVPYAARKWLARAYRRLDRDDILELVHAGFVTPDTWLEARSDQSPLNLSIDLIDLLNQCSESENVMAQTHDRNRNDSSSDPRLVVDGVRKGERREIRWGGRRIALTPKCFKFLAKLAVARAAQPNRWVTRDELERGENQARYLHRLKGELESQCADIPTLWENNRRGGYRLQLEPSRLVIDWNALMDFDDFDLVDWVQQFRPAPVVTSKLEIRPAVGTQPAF